MKSKQFCSVCKEWLEMEVVPTGDGEDDDGVVWYRCPQCQGFLPKLKGTDPAAVAAAEAAAPAEEGAEAPPVESEAAHDSPSAPAPDAQPDDPAPDDSGEDLPWDSPADMMASRDLGEDSAPAEPFSPDAVTDGGEEESGPESVKAEEKEAQEPVEEYRALLEATDQGNPRPYRPWDSYEVGECILHLAWEDCGVVVANEELPGGRQVIKCYFSEAGVVRLIQKAPR